MLPREALPRFDIPGFEIKMKPDSNAVNKKNSEKYLQDTVAVLIHELSQERFALETRILECMSQIIECAPFENNIKSKPQL